MNELTSAIHSGLSAGMEITAQSVVADIRECLIRGANSRHSPMHTPVVATADGDMRVMVLRQFDILSNTLRFHTDARSPKVAAIGADAAVHVLAYDPEAKVQIRMRGRGRVERTSSAAEAAWQASTNFAKRCYLAENAPGAVSQAPTSGLPAAVEGILPDDAQIAPARANFAILLVDVAEYDWLYLANGGHRRARVVFDGAGQPKVSWLTP